MDGFLHKAMADNIYYVTGLRQITLYLSVMYNVCPVCVHGFTYMLRELHTPSAGVLWLRGSALLTQNVVMLAT